MFSNIDTLPLGKLLQTSYGGKKNKKKNNITSQLLNRMPSKPRGK